MLNVLVADDEYLEREAMKIILGRLESVQVVGEAENGSDAVEKARELQPDLIFMDVRMPLVDGIEACRIIKREIPEVKVVLVSAYDEFKYAQKAIRAGVTEYLLKPARPSQITEIVQSITKVNKFRSLDVLNNLIHHKDFTEACKVCEALSLEISLLVEPSDVENKLRTWSAGLMQNIDMITESQIELYLDQIFQDAEPLYRSGAIAYCLFNVVHEIFVQNSITRYPQLYKVFELLKRDRTEEWNLNELADEINMSVSHLSRIFKKSFGINFGKYINLLRIEKAKYMLAATELSIGDIAYEAGYGETNYFCKVFKKHEGVTATQYRESSS